MKNVLGKMPTTTVPRTPGRDFAGLVDQGPPHLVGRPVFGTGGDLAFRRDGSHAEYLVVPAEAVLIRPEGLKPEDATALALAYLTAWSALVDTADLRAVETVLITGVTGSVGSAAARIARFTGATVLGTVRQRDEAVENRPVDLLRTITITARGVRVGADRDSAFASKYVVVRRRNDPLTSACCARDAEPRRAVDARRCSRLPPQIATACFAAGLDKTPASGIQGLVPAVRKWTD